MPWYEITLRRSIIQEVNVNIHSSGRVQARKIAETNAKEQILDWKITGTVDCQPYSVAEKKIKDQVKWLSVEYCGQCHYCINSVCDHPRLIKRFPEVDDRIISPEQIKLTVLDVCPLEDRIYNDEENNSTMVYSVRKTV